MNAGGTTAAVSLGSPLNADRNAKRIKLHA
ncbi:MAG: hypothetical protein ACI80V_001631 [Rhodothermales bacterium]|jgi:hypothetical protein